MKKLIALVLNVLLVLSLAGCNSPSDDGQTNVPEDFAFSLTWGTLGLSSYDSQTGKLIKTTAAKNPSDFAAYYKLTEKDKEYIYGLIEALDIDTYPDVYNPYGDVIYLTQPRSELILTVIQNGKTKTIKSECFAEHHSSNDPKGQAYLSLCLEIIDLLTSTKEWKALPPYTDGYGFD